MCAGRRAMRLLSCRPMPNKPSPRFVYPPFFSERLPPSPLPPPPSSTQRARHALRACIPLAVTSPSLREKLSFSSHYSLSPRTAHCVTAFAAPSSYTQYLPPPCFCHLVVPP